MSNPDSEIKNILDNQDPAYSYFYNDYTELFNYNQDGSYFYGMSVAKALVKTAENAETIGLRKELISQYLYGSSAWNFLTNQEKTKILKRFKINQDAGGENYNDLYFPGAIHIVEALTSKFKFKTIPEIGTDRENIYYFNGQIFERGEEIIKTQAHNEYIKQWQEMFDVAGKSGNSDKIARLRTKIRSALNAGPTSNQINEVLAMIRRTTFTSEQMNPSSYIPFKNGLLNLKTRKVEQFSPDLFFTYQINANILLGANLTLKDTPLFANLLRTAYHETDIPTVLSYFAYSFYPDLPAHRVLFILGRERIGKGTSVRILQGLMPIGSGSISLARLLTSERFQFTGIEGKNLLIDSEAKRKFRKGTILDWSSFCNLFGQDTLSIEPKGKESHDYVSSAKGIFLGNLPFIAVDNPPAISRILIVQTRNERPKKEVKDLHVKILNAERDKIATLLMQQLFDLMDNDFNFPGQLTDEETSAILEQLSNPVDLFIEEATEPAENESVTVDNAYTRFDGWCNSKGIPTIARQTFVKKFGYTYPKKRLGPRGNRYYAFMECNLIDDYLNVDIENKKQVGHGNNHIETLKYKDSRNKNLVSNMGTLPLGEKNGYVNSQNDNKYTKDSVPELDTDDFTSRNQENRAPHNTEHVPNLLGDFSQSQQSISKETDKTSPSYRKKNIYYYQLNANFDKYGYEFFKDSDIELQSSRTFYFNDSTKIKFMLYQLFMSEEPENTPDGWFSFLRDSRELLSVKEYNALSKGDQK